MGQFVIPKVKDRHGIRVFVGECRRITGGLEQACTEGLAQTAGQQAAYGLCAVGYPLVKKKGGVDGAAIGYPLNGLAHGIGQAGDDLQGDGGGGGADHLIAG